MSVQPYKLEPWKVGNQKCRRIVCPDGTYFITSYEVSENDYSRTNPEWAKKIDAELLVARLNEAFAAGAASSRRKKKASPR